MTSTRISKLILGTGVVVLSLAAAVVAALIAADDEAPYSGRQGAGGEVGRFVEPGDNPLLRPAAAEGRPVPTSRFAMLDGTSSSLAAYGGRPLVLNFFGSWCPPCIAEMPAIERVHRELGDRVAFLGLAIRDTVSDARGIVEETGVTYDTGRDPKGLLFTEIGAFAMPSTVFVTAGGTIAEVHGGELTEEQLTRKIEELLL